MDGWADGLMDKQKSPCVLQDFIPFRATAEKTRIGRLPASFLVGLHHSDDILNLWTKT